MTTGADLVAATRRHLYGAEREQMDVLAASLTASTAATSVQLTYDTAGVSKGTRLSCGLEEMYVWSVDDTSKTATVQRAAFGTTVQAHTAGDVVYVEPRFSDYAIFQELNNELLDLSAPSNGLYQIRVLALTAVSGQVGYDFAVTGFLDVADIRWQDQTVITKNWFDLTDYDVVDTLPVSAFPSGSALFIHDSPTPGQTIQVRYKSVFTTLIDTTTDVATTGLPTTGYDLPPLGAAIRLMSGRPVARADYDSQGDTRRPTEVGVNDVLQAPAALRQLRTARIAEEARRLRQQWPATLRTRVRV